MNSETIRRKKPVPRRKSEFNLPGINSFELENGLPVYFVRKDTLPVMNMSLVLDAGSKYDPQGKKGLSNLLSMVVDEGAGEYDALQLSDQFEVIGANFSVSCDQDSIYLSLQALAEEFERGAELFSAVVTSPHLDKEDFDREKRKITTRILQNRDDIEEIANQVFEFKLFGVDNPYASPTIGYQKDIDSITAVELRDYFESKFDPSNAFLAVVGSYDEVRLREILNKYFSNWKSEGLNKSEIDSAAIVSPGLYIVNKQDSVQSEIRTGLICYKRNEYDFFSRSILNIILGGQFTSRLNLNLREKRGFTYGIYSRFIYLKSGAYFFTSTSVSSENTGAALGEILKEIKNIRNGVTAKELEFAKSSLIRKFPSGFETNGQIASGIIGQIIHSLPQDYFRKYPENIKQVTRDQVKQAAADNLFADKLTTVIAGNKEKIINQLKEIYPGNITELDARGRILS